MKKITFYSMTTLMLGMSICNTGCMGSFKLTKSLYGWNEKVSGNKFINNFLFWILSGIQVYTVTIGIDYIILNFIEFWSGSNPLSMNVGDEEKQAIMGKDGNRYEITATKNRFDMVQLTGTKKGTKQSILFHPAENSCTICIDGKESKLFQYDEQANRVEFFGQNGTFITVNADELHSVAYASAK